MAVPIDPAKAAEVIYRYLFVDANGQYGNAALEPGVQSSEFAQRARQIGWKLYPNGFFSIGTTFNYGTFLAPVTLTNTFITGLASFTTNSTANVTTLIGDRFDISVNTTAFKTVEIKNASLSFSGANADADAGFAWANAGLVALTGTAGGGLSIGANGASPSVLATNDLGGLYLGPGNSAINLHSAFSYLANGVTALGIGGFAAANASLALNGLYFAGANNNVRARLYHTGTDALRFVANTGGSLSFFTDGENNSRLRILNDGGGIGFGNGSVTANTYISRVADGILGIGLAGYGNTSGELRCATVVAFSSLATNGVTTNTFSANVVTMNLVTGNSVSANVMAIQGQLQVNTGASLLFANTTGGFTMQVVRSADMLAINLPSSGDVAVAASGDTFTRLALRTSFNGMALGNGSVALDTSIARGGVKTVNIGTGGDATGILQANNITLTSNLTVGNTVTSNNIVTNNISAGLGTLTIGYANNCGLRVSMGANTTYTADCDGLVKGYIDGVTSGGGAGSVGISTEAAVRDRASMSNGYASVGTIVRKGQSVTVFRTVGSGTVDFFAEYIPFGRQGNIA